MTEWLEPAEINVPADLQNYVGGHPLVARVLVQRGITSPSQAGGFLDPRLYKPTSASDLPNLDIAAARIELAIRNHETLCVWGDFDVDGQTATTLLVSTLRGLGANVTYHIPVRKRESHGIKLEVLQEVLSSGAQMILTCDTGIAEHRAIDYAQSRGVDVIVTDHHTLPSPLPDAHAVVNPQMLPPEHPLRDLPGVGVAYKLAEALYAQAGKTSGAEALLDLVALGIVADVAVQRKDTRYLLQSGLDALRRTQRQGLRAMFELAELNPAQLTEEHIGFVIAPRLNALGRLGDANPIVEFLTTSDLAQARVAAQQLEGLNAERKLLASQIYQGALAQIERDPAMLDYAALVLAHPAWEPGVIGIVAGRLAERFHRPVVLLAGGNNAPSHWEPGSPSGSARGSARSVEGINITEALAAHADLLISFGGHPMAAGLTLEAERIPAFRRALSETVAAMREGPEAAALQIDGFLPLSDLSLRLVEDLSRLAPFGPGNPPLRLATRNLALKSWTTIGRTQEHLQLFVEDEAGEVQKVFFWQGADNPLPEGRFDLAYTARASDYRGERRLQIEWVDFRPAKGEEIDLRERRPSGPELVDYRQEAHPAVLLTRLREAGVQVWAEGEAKKQAGGVDRLGLAPSRELAVWTLPPGPEVWQAALEQVRPEKVYLFSDGAGSDRPDEFLQRLAGMLKFAARARDGVVEIDRLAAGMAHRESAVRKGLEWMAARGLFTVAWLEDGRARVQPGIGKGESASELVETGLRQILAETKAYREFFRTASVQRLAPGG